MGSFYAGQRVVCVIEGGWVSYSSYTWIQRHWFILTGNRPRSTGPAKDEVLIVGDVLNAPELGECLVFAHLPGEAFLARCFRPVDALKEQLERIESEGAPAEPELIEA